jgi:hypothetical protein
LAFEKLNKKYYRTELSYIQGNTIEQTCVSNGYMRRMQYDHEKRGYLPFACFAGGPKFRPHSKQKKVLADIFSDSHKLHFSQRKAVYQLPITLLHNLSVKLADIFF